MEPKQPEPNQTALYDILTQLVEALQWAFEEIENLRKVVCSTPEMNAKYQADAKRPSVDVSPASIRALHQRVLAMRRETAEKR